ncbi:shootin-1 isoform X2 [Scophthalmus maximus]|uniref:shootin-1 isoform X2 n=1 Tax=Scophthalmus maximus TaxID=52904 RepID=UPI001FA84234|nr:shootin-1 isoform X2 [Scophthalmus maximus]
MAHWHPLLPVALQEYESLQRKHETAAMECKRLEEERNKAVKELNEIQQVSQLVIEEVSVIQENLEIERTCRESAEALASKLNRQNRSLKRKSMMLLSHLSPNAIAEINLEDDEEEEEEEDGKDLNVASKVCLSPQCHTTISELQSKLELTLKEKRQAETDLEAIRDQLRETREELLKEKNDNTVLIAETLKQKKLLGKYNRVSQFAVEEYKALQDTLSLEQNLRTEAENFGRAMMIEKKKLQRQSQILMQSSSPSHALQEALTQVTSLTRDLETQRLGHQNQIKQLEDRLSSCEAQRELTALRRKLDLVEEEKREYSDKCSKTEVEVKDLRFTVEELQKKLQAVTNPPPAPAPPPPPPPPPPPAPAPSSNPLSSLLSLIRKRRDICTDIPLEVQDSPDADVRQQAVDEMMQRIKRGVQLRPVSQATNRTRRQMQRLPSNTAIQELKGIMENFNRSSPRPKAAPPPTSRDEELQRILLRRRDAVDSQHDASLQSILSPAV